MIVFLNGCFLPEDEAKVSIFDRSFLYGDGLFETVLVCGGKPFRWRQHLDRLQRGADFLRITLPFPVRTLTQAAEELLLRNGRTEASLRVTLSRGVGARGYLPRATGAPGLAMSLHDVAERWRELANWRLQTATWRVPTDALSNFKTANKLRQILARAEAEAHDAEEALLLNSDGEVAEGSSSNVFWIKRGTVHTPPVSSGALAGITRSVLLEICDQLQIPAREETCPPESLHQAEGVFLTFSSRGVVEAVALDGRKLQRSAFTRSLHESYIKLVEQEARAD